ncbi:hypothetical protein F5B22DRAFT_661795 [Xylaria bambusicola]|uniref:uncharacterized protein n=1 Tax=Xylaria bambusicola TaxID=326684 RepID=UPI002008E252|nr:uncharacterized protein F5B22DRAFT_661795 [Xylaria bambusicola]KAI0505231.1 hypothetical protein F5B22DRAFT_661795 [Xylaria bambusicola]
MSGIADSAKNLTSPQGKAASQSEQTEKAPQTPLNQSAPRSIPDVSESNLGEESGDNEGEMVPAAGRINDKGEVIDDDGNTIGKVTDGEASKFNGYIVTQEGDILDDDGGVVGKAQPLDDVASDLNYTTRSAKDTVTGEGDEEQQEGEGGIGGGLGSALGGVANTAGSAVGGATGAVGDVAKGTTGAVGDTVKGAADTAGEATGTQDATGAVGDTAKGVTDTAGDAVEGATDAVGDTAEGATGAVGDAAQGATEGVEGAAQDTTSKAGGAAQDATGDVEGIAQDATGEAGDAVEDAQDNVEGAAQDATGEDVQEATGAVDDAAERATGAAQEAAEGAPSADLGSKAQGLTEQAPIPEADLPNIPSLPPSVRNRVIALFDGPFTIADGGKVKDQSGQVLGKLSAGSDIQDLVGKNVKGIDEEGNLLGENDTVLGKIDIAPEGSMAEKVKKDVPEAADRLNALEEVHKAAPIQIPSFAPSVADKVIAMFQSPFNINENGQVTDQNGRILGKLAEGQDYHSLIGKDIKGINEHGQLLGDNDTELGKVNLVPEGSIVERIKDEVPDAAGRLDAIDAAKEQAQGGEGELPDISILEGLKINKMGNVIDRDGNVVGKVKEGSDLKKMVGRMPDKSGKVWDDRGNVIGEVEVLPEPEKSEPSGPFEDFPDATVDKNGKVIFEGRQVGVVVGDDWQNLIGKKVDADGDILDKNGNVIGHAERQEEEEPQEPEEAPIDYSVLKDKKVNKLGNVVDDKGQVWGQVVQGIVKHLAGKRVGDNGEIFNDAGKVIGKAEPIPDSEREEAEEPSPFEDFPGATVGDDGAVLFNGEQVGIVVEGDIKKLKGKQVDADGDILDRAGNKLGRAERWEPEPEPEEEQIDMSSLAGKRINKAGNAVDSHGDIYGRVIEGALPRLIGKMCDKNGFIRNEAGDVIGKCELVPEAEREGMKEGPFAELEGCVVTKEGKVTSANGQVVGRLVSGDPHVLAGRPVDADGDILDKNGNVLGHAERWEEPEVEKDVSPMSGRKVNREGNVVGEDGDIIGKLTSGELSECAGKKIDDDADVIDQKGNVLGHCSLLSEIPDEPEPEPEETEEERQARLQREQDAKIAGQIAYCIEQSLDKIKPICRMIAEAINIEEAKSEEDRDEEELVNKVRPLIEEGGKILTEANGVIRGLDPDGRISAQAKHRSAGHEATPEEYHLAELLKELTGTVTETIENAKRKLENLPKAKKKINPLWGLLSEPLFQIIAAVGLLLSGVLGLVGKLLNGLGLGNLVGNLLGGLGISKVLDGLGLGTVLSPITGGSKKK